MIDTHCHLDQYSNPLMIANECERLGIVTLGMTNLPSHFEKGVIHLAKHRRVRLALGLHPLYAKYHDDEFPIFIRNVSNTSYIGEIGLDFSKEGIETKHLQLRSFIGILKLLKNKRKILSIHSRQAEKEVYDLLVEYKIESAIFHWYSGPVSLIDQISKSGFYFSINPSMTKSKRGQEIISRIPDNKILSESDGPFIELNNRQIKPQDVAIVIKYLSRLKNMTPTNIEELIDENFKRIISNLKQI